MTYWGTNTYLLGHQAIAVIDPGPDDAAHLSAILAAVGTARVTHVIVTHNHLDHSPLARRLADATGAQVFAFGTHLAGRSTIMQRLAAEGLAGGGEGIDHDFAPDVLLEDDEVITGDEWSLRVIHTPGHIGNHISLAWGDTIFTGDHVMGWASSLVSPPDGDLTDFMTSCARLGAFASQIYYPAHGAPITDPHARLSWLVNHRKSREAQILAALQGQTLSVAALTRLIYTQVAPALLPAAERNVFAHLVDLHQKGVVTANPTLSAAAKFQLFEES